MKLQSLWYLPPNKSMPLWFWLMLPLMGIFYLISCLRRSMYRVGILHQHKVKAHVVVVGNISVGGNGKTPLVLKLAKHFKAVGKKPGILSRGYGGKQSTFPHLITYSDTASVVGDEPKLMFDRLDVPVVIDPKRARGAQFLHDECGCDMIICDDGLQHYALHRDIEIVVMDKREVGNGFLLPMGPLREGVWRLDHVDALVFNSHNSHIISHINSYTMELNSSCWVNVLSKERKSLPEFSHYLAAYFGKINAVAGIGDPNRFFETLKQLSINTQNNIGFDDHHHYQKSDLPSGIVLMTEKDAVKCRNFASADHWYLEIEADIPNALLQQIDNKLRAN